MLTKFKHSTQKKQPQAKYISVSIFSNKYITNEKSYDKNLFSCSLIQPFK